MTQEKLENSPTLDEIPFHFPEAETATATATETDTIELLKREIC